jgi:hypothetical protein
MSTLRAVSLLNKPTTESTALLRELSTAEGLTGQQAVYGLGTHASRAAANGQDAAPIVRELVDGLGGAKTPQEEQSTWLPSVALAPRRAVYSRHILPAPARSSSDSWAQCGSRPSRLVGCT